MTLNVISLGYKTIMSKLNKYRLNSCKGFLALDSLLSPCGFYEVSHMKRIKLTQGKFALVDDEVFEWLNTWKWHASRSVKPCCSFYAKTTRSKEEGYGSFQMHRLLMVHPKGMVIDHINHNGLDNRKEKSLCSRSKRKKTNKRNFK